MNNHFGKGLMAGLATQDVRPASELTRFFCAGYNRDRQN
nr:DUF2623 family protein [Serratia proteamaculans]